MDRGGGGMELGFGTTADKDPAGGVGYREWWPVGVAAIGGVADIFV